jgi:hypothetical protein
MAGGGGGGKVAEEGYLRGVGEVDNGGGKARGGVVPRGGEEQGIAKRLEASGLTEERRK